MDFAINRFEKNLIVAHKRGEMTCESGGKQRLQGERGFARAGRPDKQESGVTDNNCRAVGQYAGHDEPFRGRMRMKRAPLRSPLASTTFSASSDPPCASAICRLIDRPRPEFWPNASPAGRSV